MKIVVYTACFGGKDILIEPSGPQDGLIFIAFSDQNKIGLRWQPLKIFFPEMTDPRRQARYVKLHPHILFPEYDFSLWVDGSFQIVGDLNELIKSCVPNVHTLCRMRQWPSIGFTKYDCYDEARHCDLVGKGHDGMVARQVAYYRSMGHPERYGLWETGVMLREHNHPDIVRLNRNWWKQIEEFSPRDQVSLPYVMWKHSIKKPAEFNQEVFDQIFKRRGHLHKM